MNISNNSTADIVGEDPSPGWLLAQAIGASVCYIVCVFIIIVNTLFLVCFFINRRREWMSHSKNIISVVMMDWLVGFTGLCLISVVALKNVNASLCMTSQAFGTSSQVGSHMNIFRLCVFRLVSLRAKWHVKESSKRSIIIQTVLVYVLSTCLCSLPVYIWGTSETVLLRCTWTEIYEDDILRASEYMLYVTLVPTLVTTVLYIVLCIELKRSSASVVPKQTTQETLQIGSDQRSGLQRHPVTTAVSYLSVPSMSLLCGSIETHSKLSDKKKSQVISTVDSLKTAKTVLEVPENTRIKHTTHPKLFRYDHAVVSPLNTIESTKRKRLNNVLKTVGSILLCMNVCIIPYIISIAMNVYHQQISGHVFFLSSSFLLLNSALDPIIYMVRIKHLSAAFKRMIRRQCRA